MGQAKQAEVAKPPAHGRSPAPSIARLERNSALAPLDALGNAAVARLLRSGRLAPKLSVSQPDDPSERHAELVAERLLAAESCGGCDAASPCASCAAGLHRSATGPADSDTEADAGRLVASLGSGNPLAPSVRSTFEPGLGRSLGDVRVHTSSAASDAAHALEARAFTIGSDVAFASGRWSPDTPDGQRLLAHELAHVAQQEGFGGDVRRSPDEGESGVCEAGEGDVNVCSPGEVEPPPAAAPAPKKPVSVGPGVTVPSKPFGPEAAPPAPSEPDVISGADPLLLGHPLADYYLLYSALPADTIFAMEAGARRRERIMETGRAEPPTGLIWVQVPLSDLLDSRLTSWSSHAEIVDELFEGIVARPATFEDAARTIADNDARRLFLEGRIGYDVDIELEDPDAQIGGPTRLRFRVGMIQIEDNYGDIPLSSLDALPGPPLASTVERASRVATQAAEAAVHLSAIDTAVTKTQTTAADVQASPDEYALNDVHALSAASQSYLDLLTKFTAELDPENDFLHTWMQGAVDRYRVARQAAAEASSAATTYHDKVEEDELGGGTPGERYTQTEERLAEGFHSSGVLGKVGYGLGWFFTEAAHGAGEVVTGGGMGMQQRNAEAFRTGQISYSAWKENNWLNLGKVAIVGTITALTAGEGEGFAAGWFGLEGGSAASFAVMGMEKGFVAGVVSSVTSDVYSSLVAAGTSEPGVAAYQRGSVVGPLGWLSAGATGSFMGGAVGAYSSLVPRVPNVSGLATEAMVPGASSAAGETVVLETPPAVSSPAFDVEAFERAMGSYSSGEPVRVSMVLDEFGQPFGAREYLETGGLAPAPTLYGPAGELVTGPAAGQPAAVSTPAINEPIFFGPGGERFQLGPGGVVRELPPENVTPLGPRMIVEGDEPQVVAIEETARIAGDPRVERIPGNVRLRSPSTGARVVKSTHFEATSTEFLGGTAMPKTRVTIAPETFSGSSETQQTIIPDYDQAGVLAEFKDRNWEIPGLQERNAMDLAGSLEKIHVIEQLRMPNPASRTSRIPVVTSREMPLNVQRMVIRELAHWLRDRGASGAEAFGFLSRIDFIWKRPTMPP